jgi:long-chain acyl-CoA synthetase
MKPPDLTVYNTVPKLFWYQVEHYGEEPTLWWKRGGLWKKISWQEYGNWSRAVGNGLLSQTLKPGDKVSILSQTRVEWVVIDMAIMGIGCITTPIYHSNTPQQVRYILDHSQSRVVFVEDQEQLDKVLSIWETLPHLKMVVVMDKFHAGDRQNVVSLEHFTQQGDQYGQDHPEEFQQRLQAVHPADIISFIYTSGTTGPPKAAMITSENVIAIIRHLPSLLNLRRSDVTMAYLPLAHIAERVVGHFMKLYAGNQTVYAESLEDLPSNLRQTGPTVMFGTPRVFEKFYARILTGIQDATWFEKSIFRWSHRVGKKVAERELNRQKISFGWRVKRYLAHLLIFRKIRDIFGGNIRFMISGGAPIAPNIIRFFYEMGLKIYEVYGMTETTGLLSMNRPGAYKIGSVGKLFPETEINLEEDGEICAHGPQNCQGYYRNEEATRELLTTDDSGKIWLHTGDIGYFDEDGFLYITDRKKDLIITAGGKNVAPQNIENLLKTSPYISQAMVYGDRKPYLTALLTLDEDEITKFARDRRILYSDLSDLTKQPEVLNLIRKEVHAKNQELASYETIKKFRILEEELDQDKDEITPTLKVKRKVVTENYRSLLEEMY